ncbi:MAG: acyl carrier protein [Phycisphaeraceae bacterium]|nr:acyl carrier protein [Phycisphaeraceae bacterium]MCW5767126.1 acyl carrier protein [Phycisphaeraceae bacterium]
MTRDDIYAKVKEILADAMGVDEGDVTPEATLRGDLGAESIDFLDIVFRLEQAFGIKIQQGELFPDSLAQNADFVQDGKVTARGIAAIKEKLPHVDLSAFEKDPQVSKIGDIFTVEALVRFVQNKLASVPG